MRNKKLVDCLQRIINDYDRLLETNGAKALFWSDDYLPERWVGCCMDEGIENAREALKGLPNTKTKGKDERA